MIHMYVCAGIHYILNKIGIYVFHAYLYYFAVELVHGSITKSLCYAIFNTYFYIIHCSVYPFCAIDKKH